MARSSYVVAYVDDSRNVAHAAHPGAGADTLCGRLASDFRDGESFPPAAPAAACAACQRQADRIDAELRRLSGGD